MAIVQIYSSPNPLNLISNSTTFLQEESESNVLAAAGVAITLNNAIDSTLHVNGEVSATVSTVDFGVNVDAGSSYSCVSVGDTGRITGAYIGVNLMGTGQTLVNNGVLRAAHVDGYAVAAQGAYDVVINHGRISAESTSNSTGVFFANQPGAALENDGRISGSYGVNLGNESYSTVDNTGRIIGSEIGVLSSVGVGNQIHNDGLISGGTFGILTNTDGMTVVNAGIIRTRNPSALAAIAGGNGAQDIVNSGKIVGDVDLGAGNDGFTATGPGFVVGSVYGGSGSDHLWGARADDWLFGDDDNDLLVGRGGNDHLDGGSGSDQIWGGGGRDVMFGGAGGDNSWGNAGADRMHGGADGDYLAGGGGNDRLFGDAGMDTLTGGGGRDVLRGGAGNDILHGERGNDRLIGGSGADKFVFTPGAPNFGNDRITDFEDGVDKIDLSLLGIADMNAFLASALSEVHGNAVIDLSQVDPAVYSGTVTLVGIAKADITTLDFV